MYKIVLGIANGPLLTFNMMLSCRFYKLFYYYGAVETQLLRYLNEMLIIHPPIHE